MLCVLKLLALGCILLYTKRLVSGASAASLGCKNPIDIRDSTGVHTEKTPGSRVEYDPFPGGFTIYPGRSLSIEFRTDSSSGLIFLAGNFEMADMVSAYLRKGHLTFARRCGIGRAFETYTERLDDGRWHTLFYNHSLMGGGHLLVDGINVFRPYHIGPCASFSSVLFGGLTIPLAGGKIMGFGNIVESPAETESAARHRFSGCLRNLRFDNKLPAVHPHYFAVSQCDN